MGISDDLDLDPDALARAEAALAGLARTYVDWAEGDLARLRVALDRVLRGEDAARADLFAIAHDVKGQAGTFGYPLLSAIAGRLCHLIQSEPSATTALAYHVDAMAEVLLSRLSGDGGAYGQDILAALGA